MKIKLKHRTLLLFSILTFFSMNALTNSLVSFECSFYFDGKNCRNRFTVDMEEKVAEQAILRTDGSVVSGYTGLQVIVAPSHIIMENHYSGIQFIHKISRKDLSYQRDRNGYVSKSIPVSGTETGSCKKVEIDTSENLF